jgi:hypothetical protein
VAPAGHSQRGGSNSFNLRSSYSRQLVLELVVIQSDSTESRRTKHKQSVKCVVLL